MNFMSPAYWVYLFMALTILFNGLKAFSRFRLWRIDAAREKLETALKELVDPGLTHAQIRTVPSERVMATPERRAAAQAIMDQLGELRARCQRHTNSIVTPMGDEMFYRYQQSLIDEAKTTVGALLQPSPGPATPPTPAICKLDGPPCPQTLAEGQHIHQYAALVARSCVEHHPSATCDDQALASNVACLIDGPNSRTNVCIWKKRT